MQGPWGAAEGPWSSALGTAALSCSCLSEPSSHTPGPSGDSWRSRAVHPSVTEHGPHLFSLKTAVSALFPQGQCSHSPRWFVFITEPRLAPPSWGMELLEGELFAGPLTQFSQHLTLPGLVWLPTYTQAPPLPGAWSSREGERPQVGA